MAQKLDKNNVEAILPLTPLQNGMLFHYLESPQSLQYFEQLIVTIEGQMDKNLIAKAWEYVTESNEMLRTVIRWDKLEKPMMVILKQKQIPIREVVCLQNLDQFYKDLKENDRSEGLDISEDPIRITLSQLSDTNFVMMITNHHILYDGWSNGILMQEFLTAYNQLKENLEPIRVVKNKFASFIEWSKKQNQEKIMQYWIGYLEGFKNPTAFPVKSHMETIKTPSKYTYEVDEKQSERIHTFCKQNKVTLAALMYTAWGILLGKYTNERDVVFGTTVSGRHAKVAGIENIVGLFINTLPLRVCMDKQEAIIETLKKVNETLSSREEFEMATLADIQSQSEIPNGVDLFRTLMVIENYPMEQELGKLSSHLKIQNIDVFEMTNYALTVAVECFDQLKVSFLYNEQITSMRQVQDIGRYLIHIIDSMIMEKDLTVGDVKMLGEQDDEVLDSFNPEPVAYPKHQTLSRLFEEQVAAHAQRIALTYQNQDMTYDDLNKKANQLAYVLIKEGVKAGTLVGLVYERSIEMIITILAILKAGGAYVPIDPEYPLMRKQDILEDSQPLLLLTHYKANNEALGYEGKHYSWVQLEDKMKAQSEDNPQSEVTSEDIAYVMYTSGSTGKPKGNLIRQYSITRVVKCTNYIEIMPEDTLLQLSNYSFDGSTFDLFGALLNGARLVLIDKEKLLDLDELANVITSQKVNVFFITTSLFNSLVDARVECMVNVKSVLTGGERASLRHMKKFSEYCGAGKLLNVYGPTESTVFATSYRVERIDDRAESIPIGEPIAHTSIYIVDQDGNRCPIGGVGELCIGGDGLAAGYLHQEALTKEKFIPNRFAHQDEKAMLYRTGDLARWREEGTIEYIDRMDHQIKLRGFRIELEEIERALMKVSGIRQVVVTVLGEESTEKYICAYAAGKPREIGEVKEELAKNLPVYMIPRTVIWLDQIPLNKNGKVDMGKLPMPESHVSQTEYVAPANEIEHVLQTIWQETLGTSPISVMDYFYEVGGHSLKATLIVSKIHKQLDVKVPLGKFLELMTIRALAQYIEGLSKTVYDPILPAKKEDYYPVSPAQRTIFLQEQFEGVGTSYHVPLVLEMSGLINL
ncbi:MAG: non-ribosomal peptide synthetase, partial [Cellulosilyticaceae bacterium]